jgi:transposase
MTPEKMFKELLGLGLNWEVIDSSFDRQNSKVVLHIAETSTLWEKERCPNDSGFVTCYDHTEVLVWRHLNVFQHECEIHCRLPRAKCSTCGHIYRVRPPWEGLSKHFTKEFEAFALILMREMPMAKVAEVMNETDTRLWRLLFKQIDAAYQRADFSATCCVGVDELNVRKGREYVTVFADLVAKRVIFATDGKDHETWTRFVEELEKHNGHRHSITQVSMDMSKAYQKGVAETCRNAQVVFDKFHVIAHAVKAVEEVRKVEIRFGGGVWYYLKKSQWIWRKNPENLSKLQKKRLGKMPSHLRTAKAYQMRLLLQEIYNGEGMNHTEHRFRVWCRWVRWVAKKHPSSLFQPMVKVADMIEKNLKGIMAHWKWRLTNAYMEGLNSLFQATKRRARGYKSSTTFITMLYLIAGKLKLPQF